MTQEIDMMKLVDIGILTSDEAKSANADNIAIERIKGMKQVLQSIKALSEDLGDEDKVSGHERMTAAFLEELSAQEGKEK